MRTIRIRVYGRVQGVGFRYYALYTARSLGITGYVRNEPDGSVEVVGSGRDPDIEAFIESIDRGPTYANVTKTETEELPFMRFEHFEIRY